MKERPILFSGPMVKAIIDGRKTQTRRMMNPQPHLIPEGCLGPGDTKGESYWVGMRCVKSMVRTQGEAIEYLCPHGGPGDRLLVRETWSTSEFMDSNPPRDTRDHGLPFWYSADGECRFTGAADGGVSFLTCGKLRPSIHMPRWASRITLEITGVRVERLQDISDDDAVAEGLSRLTKDGSLYKYGITDRDGFPGNDDYGWHWREWEKDPRLAYKKLWESINGPGSWDANPWVWVIEFKMVTNAS